MQRLFQKLFVWSMMFIMASLLSAEETVLVKRPISFVAVPKIDFLPRIDGKLEDTALRQCVKVDRFILTAGDFGKPAKNQTTCYLGFHEKHLYVAFRCEEPDPQNIKATAQFNDDLDILYDDRVEVFIDLDHNHRNYIELAVNTRNVQFDQSGFNRLHGSKTCDMDPSFNCRWQARTEISEHDWTAEMVVDVTSLGIPKITEGMTWGFNLARVRQPDVRKGDEFFLREPGGAAEYSAWAPVNDYIRETISNFHAPIEFGDLVFGDPGFRIDEFSFRSALYAFGPVGHPTLFGNNPLLMTTQVPNGKSVEVLCRLIVESKTGKKWQEEKTVALSSDKPLDLSYFISDDLENKIVLQLFDPKTNRQLYRTSYLEWAPPFVEFNLEPLYTRSSQQPEPVSFRILADDLTRSTTRVEMTFCEQTTKRIIESVQIDDLTKADCLMPVFDTDRLRKLEGGNYFIESRLRRKADQSLLAQFTQNLTKFPLSLPKQFAAVEGEYSYGGITNHAIRIQYPFAAEFVFWRSGSYIPWWEVDQAAYTNEFIECWGGGNQGCNEPMQDRECRYSTVELLENTPTRAVVHWRYALSDPHYRIYRNEWVDEYYLLYPDGVGVRQVNLWPNSTTRHEMYEALLAKPPGVQTEQLFEEQFATLSTLDGAQHSNKEFVDNKTAYREFLETADDFIVQIHFKDRMHPFTVFSFREDLMPNVTRENVSVCSREIGSADRRGHWPASRFQIDGYNTVGLDVPHHGNIGNIQAAKVDPNKQPNTWTFLIGVAEKDSDTPRHFAKNWLYPGKIQVDSPFENKGYDFSQRAFVLTVQKPQNRCSVRIAPGNGTLLHPVFLIDNPTKKLTQILKNQKKLGSETVQFDKTQDGKWIVFFNTTLQQNDRIRFEFK